MTPDPNLPKRVPNTLEYSFIVGSALRYALRRHSYATGLTASYIKEHWWYLDPNARENIKRDLKEHIAAVQDEWRKDSLKSFNLTLWKSLLEWAETAPLRKRSNRYVPKGTRINSIPPELCTAKEACEILGIKSISPHKPRFKHLHFSQVCYMGTSVTLYNRKEIEALCYKPAPKGYVSTKEAKLILGYPETTSDTTALLCMKYHNVPRVFVQAHHPHYAWQLHAVQQLAKKRQENKLWKAMEKL